ncbi:MAG TPA: metal ABC transporter substrate-binding protein [Nocardioides sp.]|nr:metal ABC transporter substrate-binding protein [Nocardioides sp.]
MRIVLALAVLLSTTACGALPGSSGKVDVAAGFYPLAWVAERVGGNLVSVTNLTQPGAEPHDLELNVRETAAIAEADVVVHESGFQPAVDDGIAQNATGTVVDVAGPDFQTSNAPEIRPDNPHFWLDPLLMADLGDAVADALVEADPKHADTYRGNAALLRGDMQQLDLAYAEGLAHCERETVVVSHDAFGYLDRYGLRFAPILGLSPGAEPTPADLSRLQDLIRADGITTVFSETLVSPKLAETLASDLGIRSLVLDPIEGLTADTANDDYLSLMRDNLAAIEEANGCR